MRVKNIIIRITFGLVVLFILSFPGWAETESNKHQCKWEPVNPNEITNILAMIADRTKKNHNKINTWQGKTETVTVSWEKDNEILREQFRNEKVIPDEIKKYQEFTREFAVDVNNGLLYDHHCPNDLFEVTDVKTEEEIQLKSGMAMDNGTYILTPDYHLNYYKFNFVYDKNKNKSITHTAVKYPRSEDEKGDLTCGSGNKMYPIYNPLENFKPSGDYPWEELEKYAAYIDRVGLTSTLAGYTMEVKVEKCDFGDVEKYRVTLPSVASGGPKVYISSAMVYSSNAGFNVVSSSFTVNNILIENQEWDYELINGVYLPVKITKNSFDRKNGDLNKKSTSTFTEQKVNHPINEEVFTYKSLGLQEGEIIEDKIDNKVYIYKNKGELIELEKESFFADDPNKPEQKE